MIDLSEAPTIAAEDCSDSREQSTIPNADQTGIRRCDHGPDIICQRRCFLRGRRAHRPFDTLERVPNDAGRRGRFQPNGLVRFGDRVQPSLDASNFQPSGAFGDVGRHSFW